MKKIRFSASTLTLSFYILVSAAFARQLYEAAIRSMGLAVLAAEFMILCFLLLFGLLFYCSQKHLSLKRLLSAMFIFFLAALIMGTQERMAERIHVVYYGLLGFLSYRDLAARKVGRSRRVAVSFGFVMAISFADELFQGLLPYREADTKDLVINATAGYLGIALSNILFPHWLFSQKRIKIRK